MRRASPTIPTFAPIPWRRLAGTLRSYLTIVYAPTAGARAEIRRLNALHREITGPGYAARDPELSLWVHATLVDSTMAVADAWLEPLVRPGAPRTTRRPARSAGRSAFRSRCYRPTSTRSRTTSTRCSVRAGRSACRRSRASWPSAVLNPPLAPLARMARGRARVGAYAWTLWPSVGLLPASVREDYGLRWGVRERLVSAWLVAGWRAWRPILPASFRQMPKALAADRRMRG